MKFIFGIGAFILFWKWRRDATERLHEDYRKLYKNHQFAY